MSDFESMMGNFRANAQTYDFERNQESLHLDRVDDAFTEGRQRLDRERRAVNLAHLIAERSARDDVLCHAVQEDHADGIWLNVEHSTITGEERDLIAIAVAYLDARGLIERKPRQSHLVRIAQRSQP